VSQPAFDPQGVRVSGDAPPTAAELAALRAAAGWSSYPAEAIAQSVTVGRWVTARLADGALIGMGRCMSDGVLYASIWDMVVLAPYRRRGIGRRIFEELLRPLGGHSLVVLVATPAGLPLYRRYGFAPESRGSQALVWRPNVFADRR
jgi:ribosomal protein S18 acetylase RimI-like enzyme